MMQIYGRSVAAESSFRDTEPSYGLGRFTYIRVVSLFTY